MTVERDAATAAVSDGRQRMRAIQDKMLGTSSASSREVVLTNGQRVHLLEAGAGPPVVHLHGTNTSSLSHLPLLDRLPDVRSLAIDRPGHGLSDPVAVPRERFREAAVQFVDELLDAERLDSVVLAGASGGGVWAIWYALSRPERVRRLVLLGSAPLLPGCRVPVPLRVLTVPVIGELLARRIWTHRTMVVRMMTSMGEGTSITRHPDLLESLVAGGGDPVAVAANLVELRALLSPLGPRPAMRIRPEDLRRLAMPTLLVWGDRDPIASVDTAETVARMMPDAQLEVLAAGHVPWLEHPDEVAALLSAFSRGA